MKEHIKHIILMLMLLFMVSGCKTNNGDIGVYYGQWALDEVTIDGAADAAWCADGRWTTWSFQNDVIGISRNNDVQDFEIRWGTWVDDGTTLTLDYRHHDDKYNETSSTYGAPSWIYIPTNSLTVLTIESQTSKAMTLSFVDSQGRNIKYTLRKIH